MLNSKMLTSVAPVLFLTSSRDSATMLTVSLDGAVAFFATVNKIEGVKAPIEGDTMPE